jgi:hypothetical protein
VDADCRRGDSLRLLGTAITVSIDSREHRAPLARQVAMARRTELRRRPA